MTRWFSWLAVGVALLFGAIQLIPYGREHWNPPVLQEPAWDSTTTRLLAVNACFDCHSNESEWPWYTNVAPFSWLVQSDVEEGRKALNFSEWKTQEAELDELVEVIRDGEMPPLQYRLVHSDARLDDDQRQALAAGLSRTWLAAPPGGAGRERGAGADDD